MHLRCHAISKGMPNAVTMVSVHESQACALVLSRWLLHRHASAAQPASLSHVTKCKSTYSGSQPSSVTLAACGPACSAAPLPPTPPALPAPAPGPNPAPLPACSLLVRRLPGLPTTAALGLSSGLRSAWMARAISAFQLSPSTSSDARGPARNGLGL